MNMSGFDKAYLNLIAHIKEQNKKIRIALVSMSNKTKNETLAEMNRHLKAIADSERCDFYNIERTKIWNPAAIKQVFSFLYNQGFVEPLKIKKPLRDIVDLIYGYVNSVGVMEVTYDTMPQVG